MADYIDRKALLDSICGNIIVTHRPGKPSLEIRGANKVINFIEEAPAVDAVEVVRCKDCKFYNNHALKDVVFDADACHWNADEQPDPDDFCSAGERREE